MVIYKEIFDKLEDKVNFKKNHDGEVHWTCFHDLRFTKEICKELKVSFVKVKKRFVETGGFCDCEVLFNSVDRINEQEVVE